VRSVGNVVVSVVLLGITSCSRTSASPRGGTDEAVKVCNGVAEAHHGKAVIAVRTTAGEQRKGAAAQGKSLAVSSISALPDSAILYGCTWQAFASAGPGTPPPPSGALGDGGGSVWVDDRGHEYPVLLRDGR
jgi:hypothetical protein